MTRKSTIQRISLGLTSGFKGLLAKRCGYMALKAEEKSMKRIRTNNWFFIYIVQKSEFCIISASVVLVTQTGMGLTGTSCVS